MLLQILKALKPPPAWWCAIIGLFAPLVALCLAMWLHERRREASERAPQQEKLLRPSGYSAAVKLDAILDQMLTRIILALGTGAMAGLSIQGLADVLSQLGPSWLLLIPGTVFVLLAAACAWLTADLLRRLRDAQNWRLGLRGEQAVAEKLAEVAECGYRAYHDIPGDGAWNVDHVVVGAQGVFAIETKARSKPREKRSGQARYRATLDGQIVRFPNGSDTKAVPQVLANARWLADYLRKKTGEPVFVEPLIAIPGWWVDESDQESPVKAMNATYLAGYLRAKPAVLSQAQVTRIRTAIEEKCRTLEF